MKINVKEARSKLSSLLNRVEEREEVVITKHGKEVARLVKPHKYTKKLPSLKDFRSSVKIQGDSLSTIITQERKK